MKQNNIAKWLKESAFKALVNILKHTVNRGFGKIPFAKRIYDYSYRRLLVNELILNVHGSKMITRVSNNDGVSYQLLFYRSGFEKYETELFKMLVTEGMTVIDIGANIGYYTLLAAKRVGDKGTVFAFEPEPENYAVLVRNIELNGYRNITPVNKAVSSQTGEVDLFLNRETGAHGFLPERENVVGTIKVETVSLDEYFKGRECPVDIIKVDVEGSEIGVLSGMQNVIKKNHNVRLFTEFWPWGLQRSGFPLPEYWEKLVESGFNFIYLINEHKQRLEPADFKSVLRYCEDTSAAKLPSANLICAKTPLKVS